MQPASSPPVDALTLDYATTASDATDLVRKASRVIMWVSLFMLVGHVCTLSARMIWPRLNAIPWDRFSWSDFAVLTDVAVIIISTAFFVAGLLTSRGQRWGLRLFIVAALLAGLGGLASAVHHLVSSLSTNGGPFYSLNITLWYVDVVMHAVPLPVLIIWLATRPTVRAAMSPA